MITARSKDQSFQDTSDAKVLRAKRKSIAFHTISHRFRIAMLFVYEKCDVLSCHCLRDRSSVLLKANCCRLLMYVQ